MFSYLLVFIRQFLKQQRQRYFFFCLIQRDIQKLMQNLSYKNKILFFFRWKIRAYIICRKIHVEKQLVVDKQSLRLSPRFNIICMYIRWGVGGINMGSSCSNEPRKAQEWLTRRGWVGWDCGVGGGYVDVQVWRI